MCFEKANNRKTNPKKLLKGRICIVGFRKLLFTYCFHLGKS